MRQRAFKRFHLLLQLGARATRIFDKCCHLALALEQIVKRASGLKRIIARHARHLPY